MKNDALDQLAALVGATRRELEREICRISLRDLRRAMRKLKRDRGEDDDQELDELDEEGL